MVAARAAPAPALWDRSGGHALWPGFDLVLGSIISWTPLVADYTRFARTKRDGFLGAGLGYLHSLPWRGASLPSFAAAFGLAVAARALARRPILASA